MNIHQAIAPPIKPQTEIAVASFKAIMAKAPGPVTVVTAQGPDGTCYGLTASAVCSVSLDPPLLLACLDRRSNTLAAIRTMRSFTVNYLAAGAKSLALKFASKDHDKFNDCDWLKPDCGFGGPILAGDIAAYAACALEQDVEAGDHIILVGRVFEGSSTRGRAAMAYADKTFFAGQAPDAPETESP